MRRITLLDTTLRDGAQSSLLTLSPEDKRAAAQLLDGLGVAYVEAGYPKSAEGDPDALFFAAPPALKKARLTAFGATRRKEFQAREDPGLRALAAAGTETVSIVGKAWTLHVRDVLRVSPEDNLRMIEDSIRYLKALGREVIFDAEHFFDGFKDDPVYAIRCLHAARSGGADILCLCDTCGGTFPDEADAVVRAVSREISIPLGIHAHNDSDMAAAVSAAAVLAGASHVQGTVCGLGERCGNANLLSVAANLQLKRGISCLPEESMPRLTAAARFICDICNLSMPDNMPYTGSSAFAHKAGLHIDGVMKNPRSFEHIPPEAVGNTRRLLLSDHSGRAQLWPIVRRVRPDADRDGEEVSLALKALRERQEQGYSYEVAEASLELLIGRLLGEERPYFELCNYTAFTEQTESGESVARALCKVRVGTENALAAGEGDGPVNALDGALRSALRVFYPKLDNMRLVDYKVRVINPAAASAAMVRVLIASTDGTRDWCTVGVSADIIGASWQALRDGVMYYLRVLA